MTGKNKNPLLVILGPTASGKTRLGIKLAQKLNGEIISADSRQVYRHMDIGTAKPTPEEQAQVKHHLIDFIEPDYNLALAEYQDMAYEKIHALHQQGKLPLLVGGTGQYISAVVEGWSIPRVPPNPALRDHLQSEAETIGVEAFHQKLTDVDPEAAEKIHPNNVRRVVRALEVYMETGQPISELQRKKPPPYRMLIYGLTMDRERLYERADQRVDHMLEAGFVDEVQHLLDREYGRDLPSMSGLGYAQLAGHLLDGIPLEEAITQTKSATHDFIRRQYVWFRGHVPDIVWHNSEENDDQTLIQACERWLHEQD